MHLCVNHPLFEGITSRALVALALQSMPSMRKTLWSLVPSAQGGDSVEFDRWIVFIMPRETRKLEVVGRTVSCEGAEDDGRWVPQTSVRCLVS